MDLCWSVAETYIVVVFGGEIIYGSAWMGLCIECCIVCVPKHWYIWLIKIQVIVFTLPEMMSVHCWTCLLASKLILWEISRHEFSVIWQSLKFGNELSYKWAFANLLSASLSNWLYTAYIHTLWGKNQPETCGSVCQNMQHFPVTVYLTCFVLLLLSWTNFHILTGTLMAWH